ncbi:hypothetical protein DLM78_07925 [Leptospira stimsonii]|uniref:Uncharacterized protein n=1 Tax=Leptospira stimsonii TaxID=2202203 RepID=A0A8B3CXM2_9LEPT|nr:hypothetical protein DLM78_07925 [Leptospira stimsonii]
MERILFFIRLWIGFLLKVIHSKKKGEDSGIPFSILEFYIKRRNVSAFWKNFSPFRNQNEGVPTDSFSSTVDQRSDDLL